MRFAAATLAVCLLGLPAAALAQYAEPAEHSIIRQTGFGWRNHVPVADGCGCSVPVRADCYDQPCCFRCGLRPLCFLQRVHRMLDCLLPCHKCCCGPFGGCLLGGRCGGGCCGPACGSGCGCSDGLPGFSDPFLDDPVPPKPLPDSGTEVRYQPSLRMPSSAQRARQAVRPSPFKVTGPPPTPRNDYHAASPAPRRTIVATQPAEQSVLRRASADEPAPLDVQLQTVRPIVRSQSPEESSEDAIPHNPLRSR